MRAISLWQPWATLVVRGIKTIETRTHGRFSGLVDETIAIHAAQKYDKVGAVQIRRDFRVTIPFEPPAGAIIGTVKIVHFSPMWYDATGASREERNEWREAALLEDLSGRYGLWLEDAVEFDTPIPYKGHQGIFGVPIYEGLGGQLVVDQIQVAKQ